MKALANLHPYPDAKGWVRGLAIAGISGLFLTLSGAFGTGAAPFAVRLPYWMAMMLAGYLWGALVARRVMGPAPGFDWRKVSLAALVMSGPFTLVVWGASNLAFRARIPPAALPMLFGSVLVIALIITSVNVLAAARSAQPAPVAPPRFLDRLPLKLRGADVWAVEAEDHYLRLHTSRGQDLILMRLADAVAELDGIEGMQVHRSWWVARDAIAHAKRGDGRAVLTLKDGAQVPVSRTYAGALRNRGWI